MNERIFELAKQAGEYARKYVADCKHYGYYMEHNEYDLQFEQKFAELIVLRCAELSDLAEDHDLHGSTIIKRHFGVE